jgi:hypothetical protein
MLGGRGALVGAEEVVGAIEVVGAAESLTSSDDSTSSLRLLKVIISGAPENALTVSTES